MSSVTSDSLESVEHPFEEEIEDPLCDILTDYLVNEKGESIVEIMTQIRDELKNLVAALKKD